MAQTPPRCQGPPGHSGTCELWPCLGAGPQTPSSSHRLQHLGRSLSGKLSHTQCRSPRIIPHCLRRGFSFISLGVKQCPWGGRAPRGLGLEIQLPPRLMSTLGERVSLSFRLLISQAPERLFIPTGHTPSLQRAVSNYRETSWTGLCLLSLPGLRWHSGYNRSSKDRGPQN